MAERKEFFEFLDWLHCWFCGEQCSANLPFYFLQCGGVCCIRCINKMRQPKPEHRIKCAHCKKLVASIRIHPEMSEKLRSKFENPEKYLDKYIEAESTQSEMRQNFIDYMQAKIENLTNYGNDLRKTGNAIKKNVGEIANKHDQLIARLSTVIPVERIEQMLQSMTLEQIQQMPYEQMVPRQRRRDSYPNQSECSHSQSTSSQYRSPRNTVDGTPSNSDFNSPTVRSQFSRQLNNYDRRQRNSHDTGYHDTVDTIRSKHRHELQTPVAVDTRRKSGDHYRNLDVAGIATVSRRRPNRHSFEYNNRNMVDVGAEPRRRQSQNARNARNVSTVCDPNARMAFHR